MTFSPPMSVVAECFGDSGQKHLIQSLIQKALRKVGVLDDKDVFSLLPIVEMEVIPGHPRICCVFLLCRVSSGIDKFFNELLSKWLIPGQRLRSHFFIHSNFSFLQNPEDKFSFCEMRFLLQEGQDAESLFYNFAQIAPDMKLGATSPYQAHKILEHRGFFSSEKNSLIHERIASLVQKRPFEFDYDVFGQMQHFFLSCEEDFKHPREYSHLSRIVYVFYLFRKNLKRSIEKNPGKRHVSFKVSHVRLHQPFGLQKVLGIFVGINFLKKNELFEEQHLQKAIQKHLPEALVVEGSRFGFLHKEERIQIIYLEIEKCGGEEFSSSEVQSLREKFPHTLEGQVEKLMPALFMPRNEEEVMKNVIRLSQELKYIKDIPQVFISFEKQSDVELTFTIVLLRVLFDGDLSIKSLFRKNALGCSFIEDRVKRVGFVRGKYPKEATVFRLKLSKALYMRSDHTVDLLQARQAVVESIEDSIGEFRDYNGGMISKQAENFKAFKGLLRSSTQELESEGFFHSIYPVEMRAVVEPFLLKMFYLEWQKIQLQEEAVFGLSVSKVDDNLILMTRFFDEGNKELLSKAVADLELSSSQWISFFSRKGESLYLGYLFLSAAAEKGELIVAYAKEIVERTFISVESKA
jgi:hypothetical protein